MRADLPSSTAMIVSFARGFAGAARGESRDPFAERLLPRPLGNTLRAVRAACLGRPGLERLISLATLDTLAHAALRTHEIDAAVLAGLDEGARQLVLVGAGFDARAYRLPALRESHVFEVDHPSTQRLKRKKARSLTPVAKALTYTPVDFGRERLDDALASVGHEAQTKSVFVWEGVTMYLPLEATRETLRALAARAAVGSTLVVTYVEPRMSTLPAATRSAVKVVFELAGEPLLGPIPTEAMHAELRSAGFEPIRDTTSEAWQAGSIGENPLVRLFERVLVAKRTAAKG